MTVYPATLTDIECPELLGDPIGEGGARRVSAVKNDIDTVIKEVQSLVGPNRMKWRIWGLVKDEAASRDKFGECKAISESGRYLLMERLVISAARTMQPHRMCQNGFATSGLASLEEAGMA